MANVEPKYGGKVRFFVSSTHFKATSRLSNVHNCAELLTDAFGGNLSTWTLRIRDNPNGFWIMCFAHQFAHFIIRRNDIGHWTNVIKELQPEIHFRSRDVYDQVADATGVDRAAVKKVMLAAAYCVQLTEPTDEYDVTKVI